MDQATVTAAAHGLGLDGALLVRPDGFVAWRSETLSPSPEETLEEVLAGLLDRRPAGIAW